MTNTFYKKFCTVIFSFVFVLGLQSATFGAATIVINNINAAGVGFNDPTAAAPVGGNPGTTLGAQRLFAFTYAANIWGATLTSSIPIVINAQMTALTCTANAATLGSAGATSTFRNFPNAPFTNTLYSYALANKLAGSYLGTLNAAQISANFNANLGQANCLTGTFFYLGIDGNHGADVNFVAVLLHEMGHGLGFQTFTSGSTGAQSGGFPSIWDKFLFDSSISKTWDQMTNAERAASAINPGKLVWNGPVVSGAVPNVLGFNTPVLIVNSPAGIAGTYQVGAASFGSPVPPGAGLTAAVVQALDLADGAGPSTTDGCSAFTNGAAIAGHIAIIDRGICTFPIKVKNAQNAGATAVIIADNVAGTPPAGLGGTDPTITIPSVRVTQADGDAIKAQLGTGVNVTLKIDNTVRSGSDSSGRALMFAPNPFQGGSSVSHWDTSASPNQLMEPSISGDLTQSVIAPQDLSFALLSEIGWEPAPPPGPVINGTAGDNVLVITATGPNSGSYVLDGGAAVPFTGITSFTFNGLGGNDTFTVNNPVGGLFAPTGGIDFNGGGQPGDNMNLLGGGGAGFNETYSVGTTTPPVGGGGNNGDGLIKFTGPNPVEIRFTGLAPIVDTAAAASLTVNATDAANTIGITNGGVAPRVRVAVDAFEPIDFENKTAVIVNGGDGVAGGDAADAITVSYSNLPTGLTLMTINGDEGNDVLTLTGRVGTNDPIRMLPTATGSGSLSGFTSPISITSMSILQANLNGVSDFFTVDGTAGNDNYFMQSGPAVGEQHITGNMNSGAFTLPQIDVTGNSQGVVGTYNFFGPGGSDTFTFTTGNTNDTLNVLSGSINHSLGGVSTNLVGFTNIATINVNSLDGDDTFTVTAAGAPGLAINLDGGANNDTMIIPGRVGLNDQIRLAPTATGSGNLSGLPSPISFTSMSALQFNLDAGTSDFFTVDGTAGNDNYFVQSGPAVGENHITGSMNNNSFTLPQIDVTGNSQGSIGIYNLLGGGGTDTFTLTTGNTNDTLVVTSGNIFHAVGAVQTNFFGFVNIATINVNSLDGDDTFTVGAAPPGVAINLDGGANNDTIDYSSNVTPVSVNLGANAPGLVGNIDGLQENPPQVTTATGTGTYTYNPANRTFNINVHVSNLLPAAVTGFHIHRAPVGANGSVIVDLAAIYGLGSLISDGAGGFDFAAANVPLPPQHEAAFLGGATYFNVHTAAAPGGLIRGQIFANGPFVAVPGTATGTASISNIENATGGSGADSLVGNAGANVLNGGPGTDTIIGAQGNDTMNGGNDSDVITWSNGDGSDVIDGGAGIDLVQVNGSVTAGDVFTVGANATRVVFARANLVPFTLDIGTTETLISVGVGGDDTVSVGGLTGVADLAAVNLFGLDGSDTFTVIPAAIPILASGGNPIPPTLPGDTVNVNFTGTTGAALVPGAGPPQAGQFTFTNRQPVSFVSIETLTVPTTTTVATSGTPSVFGQAVVLTAAVATQVPGASVPTGTVNFIIDGGAPVAASVNGAGQATLTISTLSVGTHTIVANYLGSPTYLPSSGTLTGGQVVNQADTTSTITFDTPDPSVYGQTITVRWTVAANSPGAGLPTGTGVVTLQGSSETCTGTLSNGVGQCTMAVTKVGAGTLQYSYLGDSNFNISSDTEAHTVNTAESTATITNAAALNSVPTVVGQSVTVNFTVAATAPGAGVPTGTAVVTLSGGTDSCTTALLNGAGSCTFAITKSGPGTLVLNYSGDANFNPSAVTAPHQVDKANTTTTITNFVALGTNTAAGASYPVTWIVAASGLGSGTPTGTVTVSDGSQTCTAAVAAGTCNLISTTGGVKSIVATYNGDANFNTSVSSPAVPHSVTITISGNIKQAPGNTNLQNVSVTLVGTNAPAAALTNSSGNYSFTGVFTGASYTVTPSLAGFAFNPSSRTYLSPNTDIPNADFLAFVGSVPRFLSMPTSYATPGQPVDVLVNVASLGNEKSFTFTLNFDPTLVSLLGGGCGTSDPGCAGTASQLAGSAVITVTPAGQIAAGDRNILKLTFGTASNVPANTNISFAASGNIIVDQSNNPLEATYVTPSLMIFANGVEGDVWNTALNTAGTGDGKVDALDVTREAQIVANKNLLNPTVNDFQRADTAEFPTKGNGVINVADLVETLNLFAGNDGGNKVAVGGPMQPLGSQKPGDRRQETGDGNQNSEIQNPKSKVQNPKPDRTFKVVSATADKGGDALVSIELDPKGDEVAASFSLRFDPNKLSISQTSGQTNPDISIGSGAPSGTGMMINANEAEQGRIGVVVFNPGLTAFAKDGQTKQVVTIRFHVAETARGGQTAISFDSSEEAPTPLSNSDAKATDLTAAYENGSVTISGPGSQTVELSGRVLTPDGRALRNARVTITDETGQTQTAQTTQLGQYHFDNLEPGQTYQIAVSSRAFRFPTRRIQVTDNLTDVDFTGIE